MLAAISHSYPASQEREFTLLWREGITPKVIPSLAMTEIEAFCMSLAHGAKSSASFIAARDTSFRDPLPDAGLQAGAEPVQP
jgi:hypothetical protein